MITPRDIEEKTMTETKRNEAKQSLFAFYIGRPISYVLTIPFLYTRITPNAISIISIIFSLLGFFFVSFGQSLLFRMIGWALFFLWNLFDGIDGNIARYKNMLSKRGDLLDTLGGYLSMCLILLSMGFAAYTESIQNPYIIAIASLSSLFTIIPRTLMHRQISKDKEISSNANSLKDKETYSLAKIVALNICDPAGFQMIFMLIALALNQSGIFTIVYAFINIVVMIYSINQLVR